VAEHLFRSLTEVKRTTGVKRERATLLARAPRVDTVTSGGPRSAFQGPLVERYIGRRAVAKGCDRRCLRRDRSPGAGSATPLRDPADADDDDEAVA
jgi:hypothetical protein